MKKYSKIICLIIAVISIAACSSWRVKQQESNRFRIHPTSYTEAESTEQVTIPKFIANNIKQQPIYPIDTKASLNGKLEANKVPPTLSGKVGEND